MTIKERIINSLIRAALDVVYKIDKSDLSRIPMKGPAILITNHVSNLEGPLFYVNLRPRKTIAMAKAELFDKFFTRTILSTWNAVPIKRGSIDMQAMKACFKVLEEDNFLCIAPEGTRSKTGKLIRGKAGTTFFATQKKVPIIPMVHWGLIDYEGSEKSLFRRKVTIKVGKPFYVEKKEEGKITSEDRQKMADEMMYQIAACLPEELRGYYSDMSKATTDYITFM
ncbi:lysophospholipid acyltransferase family protein [Spirochaeta isovalerica]|uniref:1-acyl-sn-glycerol-3-phosphate acyltransferase n=1 Tax=Spirochaeta isovalerica TaxID=150 RepID=A0A841RHI1_9SPIO|nr:lysophospholipid acyltransferase family protein [Spirochaeta isovalerica]MBB6482637.1 1-acyl-sn-glycerol-3-phosphate acyltransferase [Spirochaeta isovalerica]